MSVRSRVLCRCFCSLSDRAAGCDVDIIYCFMYLTSSVNGQWPVDDITNAK